MSAIRTTLLRSLRAPATTRTFTTTAPALKVIPDSVKHAAEVADRKAADAALKGIETGERVTEAAKQATGQAAYSAGAKGSELASEAQGKANEYAGEAKAAANEYAGEAKATANEYAGEAKGKASELAGKAKGAKEEVKGQVKGAVNEADRKSQIKVAGTGSKASAPAY